MRVSDLLMKMAASNMAMSMSGMLSNSNNQTESSFQYEPFYHPKATRSRLRFGNEITNVLKQDDWMERARLQQQRDEWEKRMQQLEKRIKQLEAAKAVPVKE